MKTLLKKIKEFFYKKPLLVLDIGHSSKAKGAVSYQHKLFEYDFNCILAKRILEIYGEASYICSLDGEEFVTPLKDLIDIKLVLRDTLKELPKKINSLNPTACISLHANAYDSRARGTETLYAKGNDKSKTLASLLFYNLNRGLKLSPRGIKSISEDDRGGFQVFSVKCPNCISEPFFIDNFLDTQAAIDNFEELAKANIQAFLEFIDLPKGEII